MYDLLILHLSNYWVTFVLCFSTLFQHSVSALCFSSLFELPVFSALCFHSLFSILFSSLRGVLFPFSVLFVERTVIDFVISQALDVNDSHLLIYQQAMKSGLVSLNSILEYALYCWVQLPDMNDIKSIGSFRAFFQALPYNYQCQGLFKLRGTI